MSIGQIVQVIGAVVDIEFPRDAMPKIYEALVLKNDEADSLAENGLTFEVEQQLGSPQHTDQYVKDADRRAAIPDHHKHSSVVPVRKHARRNTQ